MCFIIYTIEKVLLRGKIKGNGMTGTCNMDRENEK
jgi:hypothetical protein